MTYQNKVHDFNLLLLGLSVVQIWRKILLFCWGSSVWPMGYWSEQNVFVRSTFYWIYDCIAMKEILDYSGEIHMVYCWAQELLGYHFSIIYRCDRMMRDVDAISRRFGPSIASYIRAAAVFTTLDQQRQPLAYTNNVPTSRSAAKYVP